MIRACPSRQYPKSDNDMNPRTQRIRALYDQLRQNLATGVAVMTPGVASLGQEATARIIKTIAVFDDFCHANDPHEEHDFGSFEVCGEIAHQSPARLRTYRVLTSWKSGSIFAFTGPPPQTLGRA
jgi:hypothetical protein